MNWRVGSPSAHVLSKGGRILGKREEAKEITLYRLLIFATLPRGLQPSTHLSSTATLLAALQHTHILFSPATLCVASASAPATPMAAVTAPPPPTLRRCGLRASPPPLALGHRPVATLLLLLLVVLLLLLLLTSAAVRNLLLLLARSCLALAPAVAAAPAISAAAPRALLRLLLPQHQLLGQWPADDTRHGSLQALGLELGKPLAAVRGGGWRQVLLPAPPTCCSGICAPTLMSLS